jgi:hypothetical protein
MALAGWGAARCARSVASSLAESPAWERPSVLCRPPRASKRPPEPSGCHSANPLQGHSFSRAGHITIGNLASKTLCEFWHRRQMGFSPPDNRLHPPAGPILGLPSCRVAGGGVIFPRSGHQSRRCCAEPQPVDLGQRGRRCAGGSKERQEGTAVPNGPIPLAHDRQAFAPVDR